MAKYYFTDENGTKQFIKSIDFANGKLTFTENDGDAFVGRDGYYAIPLRDQIRHSFVDDYPQVEKIECIAPYY